MRLSETVIVSFCWGSRNTVAKKRLPRDEATRNESNGNVVSHCGNPSMKQSGILFVISILPQQKPLVFISSILSACYSRVSIRRAEI